MPKRIITGEDVFLSCRRYWRPGEFVLEEDKEIGAPATIPPRCQDGDQRAFIWSRSRRYRSGRDARKSAGQDPSWANSSRVRRRLSRGPRR